jgi:hypothetical protein
VLFHRDEIGELGHGGLDCGRGTWQTSYGGAADTITDEIEIEDAPTGATIDGGPNQFKFSAQLSIVVVVACVFTTSRYGYADGRRLSG